MPGLLDKSFLCPLRRSRLSVTRLKPAQSQVVDPCRSNVENKPFSSCNPETLAKKNH